MYIYIVFICIHIAFLVSRSRYLPSISLCYPPAPFFPYLSFRPVFPSYEYLFCYHWGQISCHRNTFSRYHPPPLYPHPSTYPVLQLALRSVLLPHFAFKVRLSLPNNIILSLDTSPCEGGQRHDQRSSQRINPRRKVFLFFFLLYLSPFSLIQPIEYDFPRDRHHRSPYKPN